MIIRTYQDSDRQAWDEYVYKHPDAYHAHLIGWKDVIEKAYRKKPYYLLAEHAEQIVGVLPLVHIKSVVFGNQLVSMPYLTYGGVLANEPATAEKLIKESITLAWNLDANLELRNVLTMNNIQFTSDQLFCHNSHLSMRLRLPESKDALFNSFQAKLRSQIRRPLKEGIIFKIGGAELLNDFYTVFVVNMRDLGSPVHSIALFINMFNCFADSVKTGVVYSDNKPVAAGIITMFNKFVEIPWASSLRKYNRLSPNMLLYWGLLEFATNNQYKTFDFGRSKEDASTYRFKKQWGSYPVELNWYSMKKMDEKENEFKKKCLPSPGANYRLL